MKSSYLVLYSVMNSFGSWVLQEIDQRGWSQSELARRAHASRGSISNIVTGKRDPGPEMCGALARAFNYPPEFVFIKAGLLPSKEEMDPTLAEANKLISELPAEYQTQALALIRFLHKTHLPNNPKKAKSSPN